MKKILTITILITILSTLAFFTLQVKAGTGTFGYTTSGSTSLSLATNKARAFAFLSSADADYVTSITGRFSVGFGEGQVKMCIWNIAGTLMGCSVEVEVGAFANNYTRELLVDIEPNNYYYLGFVNNDGVTYYYDDDDSVYNFGAEDSSMSYTTPTNFGFDVYDKKKLTIWVTYNITPTGRLQIKSNTLNVKSNTLQIK